MNLTVYTDGGARGNPGPAAVGFVIFEGARILHKGKKYIGVATNNTAEYQAVIEALTHILILQNSAELSAPAQIDFYLDSELVVRQITGVYKIKTAHLRSLLFLVRGKEQKITAPIFYHSIRREQNLVADQLVNEALDAQKKT